MAKTAVCVRQEIIEFLRMNPTANNDLIAIGIDPDHYLARMEQGGTRGDGVMLTAAATLYRVSIKILMEDGTHLLLARKLLKTAHS